MLLNTKYKIVLHENKDHLAFSKNMNPIFMLKTDKMPKKLIFEKS